MKFSYVKPILVILFIFNSYNLFAQYPAGSPVAINGKLKINGSKLQSECNNNVQLRGMSSHGLQWTESCMNGSLDVLVSDWKIDILRLAMYVNETGYSTNPTKWKAYLDNMVDECERRGLYCIIDWHVTTPGDPNADIGIARDFWTYMATKHSGKKHVIYEICNEPSGVDWSTVKRYADDIIPRIRAVDPNTVIIVGTPEWSSRPEYAAADKLSYSNIAYALHFYAGESAHTAYRSRGDQAIAAGACVFVSEFGTSPASGTGSINTGETSNWISWMKTNNVSWCNWSYSDIAETSAALNAGSCASASWNNTTASGTYIKGQLTTSDAFTNCNSNIVPPTVNITSPANNTSFITNATITATAIPASGSTITKVDFYATTPANVTTLIGTVTSAPYTFNWNNAPLGTYLIKAVATSSTGVTGISAGVTIFINVPQAPYSGTPYPIPGKIEAENYDIGGNMNAYWDNTNGNLGNATTFRPSESVDVETDTDGGSGLNLSYTAAGEWTEYSVNVAATNKYNINFRVASGATKSNTLHVEMDGTSIASITTPANGSWTSFQTITVSNVLLTAGLKTMRLFFETGDINVNYIEYVAANTLPTVSITAPANNATFSPPATITLTATASDAGGSISKVEFYNGSTLLGQATGSYTYTWSNVAAGTYTITAIATDNSGGVTVSSPITLVVSGTANTAPVVSITTPANNSNYISPANIDITATATDADGTITKVDFYNGSTLIGTSATSPYTFSWTNVPAGTYSITAKATDNGGAFTTSSSISVVVTSGSNTPPTVNITSPSNNATFTAPASITINANATDADGTISGVDFYNGSTLIGSDATSPYSFVWNNVATGTYTLTAKATDNGGAVTTSSAITIVVNSATNTPPTVTITSPANNATFTAPASITINANAADADGTVSSVAFYNGSTLLGSDATSPYSFTWNNVAAGTYTLTAKATDNSGALTTSSVITIVVNPSTTSGVTIQCETACTVDGTLNETANAGFTGTGYVNTNDVLGASASWAVNSQTAQTINLDIRYAHNTSTGRPMSLSVNGVVQVANIPFPATGSTSTWVTTTVQISLASGANTIKMVSLASIGSPYLDAFTFASSTVSAGSCTTTVNTPPTVNITSPANNATFTAPANITINANAADADGTVSSVAFYNGATLLGSDATSPYSFTWNNVAAGTYTLTAKAIDNGGAVTTSSAITIVVNSTANTGVTIQCETACTVDGTLNETANAGFTGTGYVNTDDVLGASASWAVNSQTAQTINLDIRYAHNTSTGRPMSLSVNGVVQVANIPFPATGSTSTWVTTTVQISLASGANTIKMISLASIGSPYLDAFTFASSTVSAGSCSAGTTSTTIQGETACSVDGTLNETANAGYHGTGYVNTNDAIGASASWEVNSQNAQTVSLGIRYATATAAGRPMSLSVNGVTQISNIAFANTGGTTVWVITNVQINLSAGANAIKLVSTTAAGSPYLDELIFNASGITSATCPAAMSQLAPNAMVNPNPSSDIFTLTAVESIESFVVIDNMGITQYVGGKMQAGDTITFGQNFISGMYMLTIYYTDGSTESKKLQKTL